MTTQSRQADALSINLQMKNDAGSYNRFIFSMYKLIGDHFAQAASFSGIDSSVVRSIDISLYLCENTSPTPPYIGRVSRIDQSVKAGIALKWFVNREDEEGTIQALMGSPLLGLLLGVFKTFEIPPDPFFEIAGGIF